MANELKATVINLKSLSQNIPDPIVVGAGDAAGRKLRIIFTQEAAAQFTPETKVYLSWLHQEKNIKGYNIFTEIKDEDDEDFPPTWEISYPRAMLYEGNVLACIQIVDSVSIATSTNFTIHVLIDPNVGQTYTETDDYSDFQKMVIQISSLSDRMENQLIDQKIEFEDMQLEFMRIRRIAVEAEENTRLAREYAEQALETTQTFQEILQSIQDLAAAAQVTATEAKEIAEDQNNAVVTLQNQVSEIERRLRAVADQTQNLQNFIDNWDTAILDTDVQPLIDAAKTEIMNTLEQHIEETDQEHQDLWNMFNFEMVEDDPEEVGD